MKTVLVIPTLCLQIMAWLCLMLCLTGCATQRVNWTARVGLYTYEQAVTDLGAPENEDKLADGTRTAEWLSQRGYTYTESGPGPYGPFYPTYPKAYTALSQYLQLTFGPDGQLAAWKWVYR